MNAKKATELSRLNPNLPTTWKIISIVAAVIGAISMFFIPFFGLIALAFAGFAFFQIKNSEKQYKQQIENTNRSYENKVEAGKSNIISIIEKWNSTVNEVEEFEKKGGERLLGGNY